MHIHVRSSTELYMYSDNKMLQFLTVFSAKSFEEQISWHVDGRHFLCTKALTHTNEIAEVSITCTRKAEKENLICIRALLLCYGT